MTYNLIITDIQDKLYQDDIQGLTDEEVIVGLEQFLETVKTNTYPEDTEFRISVIREDLTSCNSSTSTVTQLKKDKWLPIFLKLARMEYKK